MVSLILQFKAITGLPHLSIGSRSNTGGGVTWHVSHDGRSNIGGLAQKIKSAFVNSSWRRVDNPPCFGKLTTNDRSERKVNVPNAQESTRN